DRLRRSPPGQSAHHRRDRPVSRTPLRPLLRQPRALRQHLRRLHPARPRRGPPRRPHPSRTHHSARRLRGRLDLRFSTGSLVTSLIMAFTPAWHRLSLHLIMIVALLAGATALKADLIWDPVNGWRVEGGVLAGVAPADDSRNALDHMNKAREAEEAGHNGKAIGHYERVAKDYNTSIYAAEAHFRLGKLYAEGRRYYKAFDTLQTIVEKFPNSQRFNETIGVQYQIATDLIDGARNRIWGVIPGFNNRSRGVEYLETIIATAPYSDYAPLSLMSIARAQQHAGEPDAAIDALDRMVNNYPQSFLAPD